MVFWLTLVPSPTPLLSGSLEDKSLHSRYRFLLSEEVEWILFLKNCACLFWPVWLALWRTSSKVLSLFALIQNSPSIDTATRLGGVGGGICWKHLKANALVPAALGQGITAEANNRQTRKLERKGWGTRYFGK